MSRNLDAECFVREGNIPDPVWPWPRIEFGATTWTKRLYRAPVEKRAEVFASAERELSPDLIEWNGFLHAARSLGFPVPPRWDDWHLGRAMRAATEAAESAKKR